MLKNKRLLFIPPLVIAVTMVYWGYSWWQSPAATTGTIQPPTTNVLGSETSLQSWKTAYFETRIPSYLLIKNSNEAATPAILGSYLLTSTVRSQDDQVGVTIGNLGNYSLDEISGVSLRLSDTADYSRITLSYAPSGAYAFSHIGSYETSVFWQNGTHYMSVVVSGTPDRQPYLEQTLRSIVSNWQWL